VDMDGVINVKISVEHFDLPFWSFKDYIISEV